MSSHRSLDTLTTFLGSVEWTTETKKIRRQFEYESIHSNCRKKYYRMKFDFVLFLSSDF